mgnify:CR=1 FL=1
MLLISSQAHTSTSGHSVQRGAREQFCRAQEWAIPHSLDAHMHAYVSYVCKCVYVMCTLMWSERGSTTFPDRSCSRQKASARARGSSPCAHTTLVTPRAHQGDEKHTQCKHLCIEQGPEAIVGPRAGGQATPRARRWCRSGRRPTSLQSLSGLGARCSDGHYGRSPGGCE